MAWIIYLEGVKRTAPTDIVIARLDPYFEQAGFIGRITRVLCDKNDQLAIIQEYAESSGLISPGFELDFSLGTTFQGREVPYWQVVWSKLLSKGIIVNPPEPAEVLMDYIKADGQNHKGEIIQESSHFTGRPFDLGARVWIKQEDVGDVAKLVDKLDTVYALALKAQAEGVGIIKTTSSPLIEHGNRCVHCLT